MLCYLYQQVAPASTKNLVNLQGESCNTTSNSSAATEWYNYTGNTVSSSSEAIYLLTDDTGTDSNSTTRFKNLFDNTTSNLLASYSNGLSTRVGKSVTSGVYKGSVNLSDIQNSTRTVNASKSSTGSLSILNLYLTSYSVKMTGGNGLVYFGVAPNTSTTPSPSQLYNCTDGTGATLTYCSRYALIDG